MRIGWITYAFPNSMTNTDAQVHISALIRMRYFNIASWLNTNTYDIHNEIYNPDKKYEIVVLLKMMDTRCQTEVEKIQHYGGKVIFDANVNYYDIWGNYLVAQTKPTEEQRKQAIWMTTHADCVVADSTYLAGLSMRYNENVVWIPDNVDPSRYSLVKVHKSRRRPVLVWSGTAPKAAHLLSIKDVMTQLPPAELLVISDREPDCLPDLQSVTECRYEHFSTKTYPRLLVESDIVISPKILNNGYELGHTEFKITTGMAQGLPAVASPQQSYLEAVRHNDGGFIACNMSDWKEALTTLIQDHTLRSEMGARARYTVTERYATAVVAKQYESLFKKMLPADCQ